jgi:hypothetical protein
MKRLNALLRTLDDRGDHAADTKEERTIEGILTRACPGGFARWTDVLEIRFVKPARPEP